MMDRDHLNAMLLGASDLAEELGEAGIAAKLRSMADPKWTPDVWILWAEEYGLGEQIQGIFTDEAEARRVEAEYNRNPNRDHDAGIGTASLDRLRGFGHRVVYIVSIDKATGKIRRQGRHNDLVAPDRYPTHRDDPDWTEIEVYVTGSWRAAEKYARKVRRQLSGVVSVGSR